MGKMLKVMFISFTLFVFSATIGRPQDGTRTEDAALEAKVQEKIPNIKDGGHDGKLTQYMALREENPFLCREKESQQEVINLLMPLRYFAEKRCDKIANSFVRKVCHAQKGAGCGKLPRLQKAYCRAFTNGDIDPLMTHYRELAKILYKEDRANPKAFKAMLLHDAGVYFGYKESQDVTACRNYIDQIKIGNREAPLYIKLACEILFSPGPTKTIDDLWKDIALFSLSRELKKKDLCQRIQNSDIKEACQNPAFKEVDDLFHSK